nr:hypothetical protein [Tanacetum cinerariifolium]
IKQFSRDNFAKPLHNIINADIDTYVDVLNENGKMSHDTIIVSIISTSAQDMALPPWNERHAWLMFDTEDYTEDDIQDFEARLGKIYDSSAWRALFGIRWLLVREIILEFFSTLRFREGVLDLDSADTFQFQLDGLRRQLSWRQFILVLGLHTAEEMETVRHALGRKQGAQMLGGHFIAWLGMHFGVITEESLQTLTVKVCELTTIDIKELIRLRICKRLMDVVSWVAMVPQRQQVGAAGEAAEALQTPQAAAPPHRTMPQRLQRVEEELMEVSGMRYLRFYETQVGDALV